MDPGLLGVEPQTHGRIASVARKISGKTAFPAPKCPFVGQNCLQTAIVKAKSDRLLGDETTGTGIYLGPTGAGKTHAKKAAAEAAILSPLNATLDKAPGLHGYEPAGVPTRQPNKTPQLKS